MINFDDDLSPVPISAQPDVLPFSLDWEALRPCLPGPADVADGRVWRTHEIRGLHKIGRSRILT